MVEKQFTFLKDTVAPNIKTPIVFNNETMSIGEVLDKLNELSEENEQLKTENTMLKEYQNINCQNCQYFVSDSFSSDCLKREDIGYKGTCIDGMDLHMLAKNCPYY